MGVGYTIDVKGTKDIDKKYRGKYEEYITKIVKECIRNDATGSKIYTKATTGDWLIQTRKTLGGGKIALLGIFLLNITTKKKFEFGKHAWDPATWLAKYREKKAKRAAAAKAAPAPAGSVTSTLEVEEVVEEADAPVPGQLQIEWVKAIKG